MKEEKMVKKTGTPHTATIATETNFRGCQGINEHIQAAILKLRYAVLVLTLFVDE